MGEESLVAHQDGEDYAALLRRLAEIIASDSLIETDIENTKMWPSNVSLLAIIYHAADEIDRDKRKLREAADALERAEKERDEAFANGLMRANAIAKECAFERDRLANEMYAAGDERDASWRKAQGATAAVLANKFLAEARALSPSTKDACPRCSDLIAASERDVFEATGVCETCAALTPKDETP